MSLLSQISEQLQLGLEEEVAALTREAIQQNMTPKDILDNGLIAGMNIVGEKFRSHEFFLPDVLLAAKAMYAGMNEIKPLLIKDKVPSMGKVVIGTVRGDLHDIGKNLVGVMLRGAGFDVIDLGNDVPPAKFIETARNAGAKVIGMSALLTTTMPAMKEVVALLKSEGLTDQIHTIVGGAPVSQEYAREIGASAYSYDASNAVDRIRALMN
ncbi:MAG: corrinoid protein [Candidatus Eisenbacteria bacterium]|uniref:Corrinoid protein n=1 Tax=Eiseniibacteriota bacterium TaxID=2212470 RepID=A0A948W8E9_UNCEI|nr:corrinoid protein [Candidatus Eisenbacteria bacterium]MBU2693250.1 corrinoid protein [Candidatus Eisenbacteria bacterium]